MRGKVMVGFIALLISLAGTGLLQLYPVFAADVTSQDQMNMSGPTDLGIPSYHAYALKPPFPSTLDPKNFPDALNRNVYALAAKIRPVLYDQPCYCYC